MKQPGLGWVLAVIFLALPVTVLVAWAFQAAGWLKP